MWPVVSDALLPFGKVERPPKAAFQLAALLNFRRRKLRASALAYAQQLVIHAVRLPRSCDREVTGAVDHGQRWYKLLKNVFLWRVYSYSTQAAITTAILNVSNPH